MRTWFKTKVTCLSVLALALTFTITEFTLGTYTVFSTYLIANFDSSTKGKIVESEMWYEGARWGVRYHYKVEYDYSVGGIDYVGNLVNLERQSWPAGDREIVEAILTKFAVGKEVTVYFDSTNPEYSVLQPTGVSRNFVLQHLFFMLTIPCFVWFASSVYINWS